MTQLSKENNKLKIIFVDDDANTLSWLRRELRANREKWEYRLFSSAKDALDFLTDNEADVVVSDLEMPGMSGSEFLKMVQSQHPETLRIIFSGMTDQLSYFKSLGVAHQFLSKPSSWETVHQTIENVIATQKIIAKEDLRKFITSFESIPSPPEIYLKINEAILSPGVSPKMIGKIISSDMGITAQILRIVNSAYFGLKKPANDPVQAVVLLGIDTVKALILALSLYSSNIGLKNLKYFSLRQLWNHSFRTAFLARRISMDMNDSDLSEDAFLAGLFHDLGKVMFAINMTKDYDRLVRKSLEENILLFTLEEEHFRMTHSEVGAYILSTWGFEYDIIEALANHHRCSVRNQFPPQQLSGIIHLADLIANMPSDASGKIIEERLPGLSDEIYEQIQEWNSTSMDY